MKRTIVYICGPLRNKFAAEATAYIESLRGKIVLMRHMFVRNSCQGVMDAQDQLQLDQIDMCDEIMVMNQGGVIDDATRREITYAMNKGKTLRLLEGAYYCEQERTITSLCTDGGLCTCGHKLVWVQSEVERTTHEFLEKVDE